ncbi:MAG: hypothetical protein JF592_09140 [Microbacterium sp.]|uniref:hypothetical protein n=1 Tax=Microbacterium sp. TaxID=51671 RepID=UPI001E0B2FCD|nr:hypothetical protein [Microbacterium sp.]MBW8762733.1 hypothetical protein [Microbacterium sp.]
MEAARTATGTERRMLPAARTATGVIWFPQSGSDGLAMIVRGRGSGGRRDQRLTGVPDHPLGGVPRHPLSAFSEIGQAAGR